MLMEHKYMWIRSNIFRIVDCDALLIEVRGKPCIKMLGIHGSIAAEVEAAEVEAHIEDEHWDL